MSSPLVPSSSPPAHSIYLLPLLSQPSASSFIASAHPSHHAFPGSLPFISALALLGILTLLVRWAAPGGPAWGALKGRRTIPGPRGWPILGSIMDMGSLAHRRLAALADSQRALPLMALSLGNTRLVIASKPDVARELLNSSAFADRPLKQSAQQLLFGRAIGFAPYGDYWRKLRRIASSHLFSPKRIEAHEQYRQLDICEMLQAIYMEARTNLGTLQIRKHLQLASLNNIMITVFGRRYSSVSPSAEAQYLHEMVKEGFELLGAFNWGDHLPSLRFLDPQSIDKRCAELMPRVRTFVQEIIDEHRKKPREETESSDFVDVLLSLDADEKLDDADMIAILWEMIFRGTDTTAILTEWILAEVVLHPEIQEKLHRELDDVVGSTEIVTDAHVGKMSYLQAVVKETLRVHPPGPLLSWARLATHDVTLAGHHIPAGTTAMVNMWAITHDSSIWSNSEQFIPERFLTREGGADVDLKGTDLRLAPFGAGRRVCPGRSLALATVHLWVARLLHHFQWFPSTQHPVNLSEVLKLSCEMAEPLNVRPVRRMLLPF